MLHRFRRASLLAAVALVWLAVGAGSAAARPPARAVSLGAAPRRCPDGASNCLGGLSISPTDQSAESPDSLTASYLGGLVVSPHLVHDGQTMTAQISSPPPLTTPCFGSAHCVASYSWSQFEALGKRVAGCGTGYQDTTCTIRVTAASGPPSRGSEAWSKVAVGICGAPGCASDEDFYYAQRAGRGVSGYVTDATGKPVDGADVTIGGRLTTTDRSGFYSAILAPGSYSVTARGSGGAGTPTVCSPGAVSGSSCRADLHSRDAVANFEVGCGGAPPAADRQRRRSAIAGSASPCPLMVIIRTFGNHKAGLGFFSSEQDGFPTPLPEFLAASLQAEEGKCVSGCTNVQVTVTDQRTHAVVPNAQVTASVTPFPPGGIAAYPKGTAFDDGHLCRASAPSICGTGRHLPDLPPTDANGQVRFLYWSPGAISQHTVKITVKAQKHTCDPQVCSTGLQTGENSQPLTIAPHILYSSEGRLSPGDLDVLTEWAHQDAAPGASAQQWKHALTEHAIEKAVGTLVEFYAEHAVPLVVAAEAAHKVLTTPGEFAELDTELGAQEALTALFAAPLKLATFGLGSVGDAEFDPALLDAIAGKDGLLRHYAEKLEQAQKRHPITDQRISVRVLEVSYCTPGQSCGPGEQTPGINPFVYVSFRSDTPRSGLNDAAKVFSEGFVLRYNPRAYAGVQYDGKLPPS